MAKIIGMGIFALVPRPNGSGPPTMAHTSSLLGVYKIDEIVNVNLPIDHGASASSIPCKINVYAVMKGLSQHHHNETQCSYHGSSDFLHGGLRYFAVHLTPSSSISQSQHTGLCQEEANTRSDSSKKANGALMERSE